MASDVSAREPNAGHSVIEKVFESVGQAISDNKWALLAVGAIAGAALYLTASDGSASRQKISLEPGATMVNASALLGDGGSNAKKQRRVANLIRNFRDRMDKDHSGEVDAGEFCDHLKAIGLADRNLGLRLFAAIDVDNGGTLSIDEVFSFLTKLEDGSVREQVELVFNIFAGGSDKTSFNRSECKQLMVTLVGDEDGAEAMTRRIFRASGAARRNSVTRDDFVNNMTFDDSDTEKIIVDLAQGVVESVCGVSV
jgi:Ca2+-binding EF-hand superfamily protein